MGLRTRQCAGGQGSAHVARPARRRGGRVAANANVETPQTAKPAKSRVRTYKASDGTSHLGSALEARPNRPFPGPPPNEGPPLRVLPIGGLGEIGMNCMLVGVRDRYILIDAGLMFPDFQDLGMQKILPDTSFLAQWRDKIEAVVITHGHEDHIGALPWVVPALDPNTPIYAGSFVMQLLARRLTEFSLYNPGRFHTINMKVPVQMGPFEVTPIRVTHSIPDCCGLILRSEHGTIVHTGDWKIDETPVDGDAFDRESFALLAKEPVALMMSDSTNVLSPGRTSSEATVEAALIKQVAAHAGKGRVIVTQFASNLHRLASVKKAADAAGRRIAFVGLSLNAYLEAAARDGRAPFDPSELVPAEAIDDYDANKLLVVTTGSQAEPRAQLSMAAIKSSQLLKLAPSDKVLYSAKVIPGNEGKVTQMLNHIAMLGATVVQGRAENLHTSGHAYQEELEEVLRFVRPQHFLPVHGEYAFLCEHARLARDKAAVRNTTVIRNGQMLGVGELRSRDTLSSGSMATARIIGEAALVNFYNDGGRGTGTAQEMALEERTSLAFDGVVVAAVDVVRDQPPTLAARVRVTTRGMWLDRGKLVDKLYEAAEAAVQRLPSTAALSQVERAVIEGVKRAARAYNNKRPEVICVAYEHDPAAGMQAAAAARRSQRDYRRDGAAGAAGGPPAAGGGVWASAGGAAAGGGGGAGRGGALRARALAALRAPAPAPRPWEGGGGGGRGDGRGDGRPREGEAGAEGRDRGASQGEGEGLADAGPSAAPDAGGEEGGDAEAPVRRARGGRGGGAAQPPPLQPVPPGLLEQRRAANPREKPQPGVDMDYG